MAGVLAVEDIHTYYGDSYVLQGISLAAAEQSVIAVLGRNGVGKTTLIRSIISFTPPRRGRIVFNGADITGWPAHRVAQSGIGLVPQGRRIFATLTVREHLEIAFRPPADGAKAGWTLESVFELFPRLRERAGNRAATLSGGERQMLALGRALVCNPSFMLMDEPTEGLAPFVVEELKTLIQRLKGDGLAILLVEQNFEFALAVADHVYVMDKGRIVYDGLPEALRANEQVRRTYLGVAGAEI